MTTASPLVRVVASGTVAVASARELVASSSGAEVGYELGHGLLHGSMADEGVFQRAEGSQAGRVVADDVELRARIAGVARFDGGVDVWQHHVTPVAVELQTEAAEVVGYPTSARKTDG